MTCASSTDGIPAGFQDLQNVCDHGFVTTTNISLLSASPTVLVGDGTANPRVTFDKLGGGTAFMTIQIAGVLNWAIGSGGGNHFQINRYPGGVYADQTEYDNGTGEWRYPGNATYNSASPTVRIGTNAGAPIFRLDQSADEQGHIDIYNGAALLGSIYFGAAVPAGAVANGCFYFRMHNAGAGSAIYKRTGGAWVAIA